MEEHRRMDDDKTIVGSPQIASVNEKTERPLAYADPELSEHEVGLDLYRKADELEYTPEESKSVLKMIDWHILPLFMVTQGLAYLDKTATNYANLFGITEPVCTSLRRNSQQAWFASAFYIGYLVFAWPANLMLQKFSTGKVMGTICFFWGIVCACMAATHNFSGGLAVRTTLGCLEAAVTPGLGLMTPLWWKLNEQPVRHLSWYCWNGVASIIGDLIVYGLGHTHNTIIPVWAIFFVVFGTFTSVWGIILLIFLPDSPASARFLKRDQKIIAIKRVATNRTGTKNTEFKLEQVKEAFMDPKLYILFVASIAAQIPNGVASNFSSTIISGFGFTQLQTTLLDIPSSVIQIFSLVLSGYLAGHFKNSRAIMMFVGNSTCIVAAAALTYAPRHETWGRLVAFWFTSFQSVGFSLSLVMISANVAGYTKRQTINSTTFVAYCVGNIAGPHVLIASEKAAGYPTATKAMMAGYVVKTAAHLALGGYMWFWNRKWNRQARERGEVLDVEDRKRNAEEIGMTDATEWNNPYFRYAL